jgi:hypothetical protein
LDLVEPVKGRREPASLGERFVPREIVNHIPVARACVRGVRSSEQILNN